MTTSDKALDPTPRQPSTLSTGFAEAFDRHDVHAVMGRHGRRPCLRVHGTAGG
jgi:hypothetical protein